MRTIWHPISCAVLRYIVRKRRWPIESNALSDVKLAISVIGRSAVQRVNNGISNKFLMPGSIISKAEWQLGYSISKRRQSGVDNRYEILNQESAVYSSIRLNNT